MQMIHEFSRATIVTISHYYPLQVGTNFFPMDANKLPKLKKLLTPHEWTHTEAFPSILRLLLKDDCIVEMLDDKLAENDIKKLTYRRVIDNEKLEMGGADLWMHLNIQLIHLLDFLPVREMYI
jgi:hypothetical protein